MYDVVLLIAALLVAPAHADTPRGQTITIEPFGGKPDDHKDDTAAFLKAIQLCCEHPNSTLQLSPGQYDLAMRTTPPDGSSSPVLVVNGARGLTIDGRGAQFVCHDFATLWNFEHCRDVTIRNLKIDYDPLPFTAGQIIAEGDGYVDLRIEKHHPLQAGLRAESLLPYDPQRHRMGMQTRDDLYQPGYDKRTQKIADDVMRVPVTRKLLKTGDWAILRHQIYSKNAFDFRSCRNVTIENVDVYTCPGMALHAQGGENFELRKFDVTIKPGSGRWFTATADATHFNGVRGEVRLQDCLLESMGDDGTNIHNFYLRVTDVIDGRTFKCNLGKDPTWDPPLPRPGDVLEIGRAPNALIPLVRATVASARLDESNDKIAVITLKEPASQPLQVGDVIGDASALPTATLRHCIVRRNRARGALIQTRGATIDGCTFQDCSGAAIQVTCDVGRWWEGMPTRDVTIRNNTIARVNFGIGRRDAAIDVFAEADKHPSTQPVHDGIVIENNTITDATGAAIHIGSARNVTICNNTFDHPTGAAISIDHSAEIEISGNALKGGTTGVVRSSDVGPSAVKITGNSGFGD